MAARWTVKLSLSSLSIQDHLDVATIKLDEFILPVHWKYVTNMYQRNAPEITFLIVLRAITALLRKIRPSKLY